jgi:membrane peptidoglycan carboxypeptidase
MSAQNSQPRGVLSAALGMVGFSALAGLLVTVMVTPALAVTGMTASSTIGIFESLPEYVRIDEQPQQNEIYAWTGKKDKDGEKVYKQIATVYSQNRQEVKWDDVSQYLKDATVAGEDRRFYEHGGVDLTGVVRVAIKNALSGGIEGGASTLSMQLIKNIYIQQALALPTLAEQEAGVAEAQRTSFERKLKEMKLAIGIEKKFSKDEILLKYLNIAGFGSTTYGIEAAAQRYYNTSAKDVTIAQAASLIAIVQKPSARSLETPDNYGENLKRRDVIIKNMYVEGMITAEERDEALATPVDETTVHLQSPKNGCTAAYKYAKQFCDYVIRSVKDFEALGATEAERKANWAIGGYKVYTTLDIRLQKVAQETIRQYVPNTETRLKLGGATTTVQVGTGRILTMAQNKTFNDTEAGAKLKNASAINFNTDYAYGGSSGFQVGSTYKVFTLINWLDHGFGLNEVVQVTPKKWDLSVFADRCNGPWSGSWSPRNDSGETGARTVAAATAGSVNGGFAVMASQLDQCDTRDIAVSLGVHLASKAQTTNPDESGLGTNPSVILGVDSIAPLTMAAAYAGIANNGKYCKPIAVDSFVDAEGETLDGQSQECTQVLDKEVAYATQSALAGAMNGYAANPRDGIPIIGKTGTTNGSVQTYVIGATKKVSTIVWVGNIRGDFPIRNYPNGGNIRHIIGHAIFGKANQLYGGGAFTAPPSRLQNGTSIQLPDFTGQSPETVKGVIEGLGLAYKEGTAVDSDLAAGLIASTSPGAGAKMARGQTVTVNLSNGTLKNLPDVVTGNPEPQWAVDTLKAEGYKKIAKKCVVVDPGDPNIGRIVSSDPSPGTPYSRTKTVTLGVGREEC